jgi:hypothetical protein
LSGIRAYCSGSIATAVWHFAHSNRNLEISGTSKTHRCSFVTLQ